MDLEFPFPVLGRRARSSHAAKTRLRPNSSGINQVNAFIGEPPLIRCYTKDVPTTLIKSLAIDFCNGLESVFVHGKNNSVSWGNPLKFLNKRRKIRNRTPLFS